jgi:WD40 repeat protein
VCVCTGADDACRRCRKFLFEPAREVGRVTSLAFTALENKTYGLFAGYSDGKVRQWDINAGCVAHLFMAWIPFSVTSVCLGIGRMYCGYANGLIKVWDLTKLKPSLIRTQKNEIDLLAHQDGVAFMQLCDNLLFTCSDDKAMRTWDLLRCDPSMTLPLRPASTMKSALPPSSLMRLEEVCGAGGPVIRVLTIPERTCSIEAEVRVRSTPSRCVGG